MRLSTHTTYKLRHNNDFDHAQTPASLHSFVNGFVRDLPRSAMCHYNLCGGRAWGWWLELHLACLHTAGCWIWCGGAGRFTCLQVHARRVHTTMQWEGASRRFRHRCTIQSDRNVNAIDSCSSNTLNLCLLAKRGSSASRHVGFALRATHAHRWRSATVGGNQVIAISTISASSGAIAMISTGTTASSTIATISSNSSTCRRINTSSSSLVSCLRPAGFPNSLERPL